MTDIKLNSILPLLKNVRRTSNGYISRCPSHDDDKNSLSLAEGDGGKLLLKCFAGCQYRNITAALGISINGNGYKPQKQIEAVYDYKDEDGKLLYQNVRFEGKDFRQKHFDKTGEEVWNLNGVRRVPYHLPELINQTSTQYILMTEGEKDADILTQLGFLATNHKNWRPEFNYLLKGKKVVIFCDHDRPGLEQADKVAGIIYRDAAAVRVVDCFADEPLPEKQGKDISDYLKTHSVDELRTLIKQTPDYKPSNESTVNEKAESGLKVVCLSDVKAEEIIWLWKPFIAVGEFTIIEGIEGLGKSWLSCALACAVAGGKKLPFSESEFITPGNVLLLSAEDSLSHTVKPRLVSMQADTTRIFAIDEVFSLDNLGDLIKFEAVIAEYEPKLVVIDPMFSYTGGKNLNTESDSRPLARKLIAIAQKFGCAIIGVRHIGKAKGNGDARAAGLGSIAWRASARSVLLVGRDEETGEKAICQTKNNLTEESKYSVGFEISNGQFYWKNQPSRLTKEKMLATPKDDEAKVEQTEAVAFLREALRDGERSSKEIEKEAKEIGITNYALRKAKRTLGVEPFKKGGNFGGDKGWFVRLSGIEENESGTEEVDISDSRHLQSNNSNKTSCNNALAGDDENRKSKPIQLVQTASSNGVVPNIRMQAICRCGENSFVDENCQNCGEVNIPF